MPDAFFSAPKNRKRKRTDSAQPRSGHKLVRTAKGKSKAAPPPPSKGKGKSKVRDEDLSEGASDSGVDVDDMDLRAETVDPNESGEEDEEETPAEKRLRLAKMYLESVKEGLAEGEFDAAEIDKDIISARLKQDVMEHSGKVHLFVADSFDFDQPPPTLRTKGHRFSVTSAVATEDSRYLFTAGKEGSIIKWDLRTGARLATLHKLRPDGKGKAKASGAELNGHTDEVLALAISGDGRYLASGGKDRRVGVWDVQKAEWVKGFGGHRDTISSLAFRKGTQQLYSASYDRTVKMFDLAVMGYVETLFGHQDMVLAVDALRSETATSVGGRDKTARFWKIVDETQLVFRGGGKSAIRELLEGGALEGMDEEEDAEGAAKKRREREGEQKKFVEGSLECIAMVDETTFLTGGDSGSICLWTTLKKKPVFTQALAHGFNEVESETEGTLKTARWITALGSLRYSDLFASGSWDGEVRLWKLDSKLRSFELVGSIPTPGVVNSLQFVSPSKGSLDGVAWARPPSHDGNADVSSGGKAAAGPVLLVAGLGQETRLGRWIVVKENGARNGSSVFALHPRTS